MSGAVKAGSVYVSVTAAIGDFVKSMDQIAEAVQEMADDVASAMEQASGAINDFSDGLLTVVAAAGAAVAGAAEYTYEAKQASDDLKKSVLQLSAEVGSAFLPLVRELNQGVRTLTATWRGLSSETKAQIVQAVRYAAVMGVAGKATAMSVTWAKSLAEGTVIATKAMRTLTPAVVNGFAAVAKGSASAATSFAWLMNTPFDAIAKSIKKAMAAIGSSAVGLKAASPGFSKTLTLWKSNLVAVVTPILAVVAAVAGLALAAGALYKAWNTSSTGLKAMVMEIIDSIKNLARSVTDTFTSIFDSFVAFAFGMAESFLEILAAKVRAVAKFAEDIARRLGNEKWANNLAQVQNLTGSGMVKAVKEQVSAVVAAAKEKLASAVAALAGAGKETGEAIGYGLSYSMDGFKDILKDTGLDKYIAQIQGMLGGGPTLGDPNSVEKATALDDRDKLWDEYVQKLDVTQQQMVYEAEAEAKRALDAEALAFEKMVAAFETAAASDAEEAQANAQAASEAREEAHRARVAELESAAETSADLAAMARQLAEQVQQRMEEARQAIVGRLTSAFSNVTAIADAFTTGLAASGGNPLVGIATALMEVLMQSEGFQTLVEMVNTILQDFANALDALLVPLQPLLGAVAIVTQALGEALAPALATLGELLNPIVPVVAMVGVILEALSPVVEILTRLLSALLEPLKVLVDVVLKTLFEFLKGLAYAVLMLVKGLADVWNGILSTLQNVFRVLSEISIFGGKPLEFLGQWADGLQGAMIPVDGLTESMHALNQATWDGTRARAEETAAQVRNREALKEATEALTNVPPAWRVARAKYLAQDARETGGGGMGPAAPGGAGVPGSSGPVRPAVVVNNHITTYSPEETSRMVRRRLDDAVFRQTGGRPDLYGGLP